MSDGYGSMPIDNSEMEKSMPEINIFDRTLKIIARDHSETFLKLALPGKEIRLVGTLENVELSLPEERVDFIHDWKFFSEEVEQMRQVPFISDWIEEGIQKGLQEGRQDGYIQACREDIITLLEDKFGVVDGNILNYLDKIDRVESLKMLLKKVSKVETQEEFLNLTKIALADS